MTTNQNRRKFISSIKTVAALLGTGMTGCRQGNSVVRIKIGNNFIK